MSFLSCLTFFGKTQKVLKNILITFLIYCNENESGLGLLRFKKECVLHLRTRSVVSNTKKVVYEQIIQIHRFCDSFKDSTQQNDSQITISLFKVQRRARTDDAIFSQ